MCLSSLETEIFHLKSKVKGNEISFLKELKRAKDQGRDLTQEKFAKEYNLSFRQVQRIVYSLEEKEMIEKIKDGFFIIEFQLTKDGERVLYN